MSFHNEYVWIFAAYISILLTPQALRDTEGRAEKEQIGQAETYVYSDH